MKLIHLSDLHLGKRVNEFPMIEDQKHILEEILGIIGEEAPQGVIIAGDIYDKATPPTDAVKLFDDFLVRLAGMGMKVFVISGNHDSAERVAFGGRLMDASGIYLSPVYDGSVKPIPLRDAFGECRLYLLPFIKPVNARAAFPEETIASYTDALRAAVDHMEIDPSVRNVLVTHQFVTGAERCESEDINVGGSDNVDATVFEPFDYVALGHLHGPQNLGQRIRYCGTPLKYSFSEKDQEKSVTVVELGEKGTLKVRERPLHPLHDLREIRGTYDQLTLKANYAGTATDDYLHVVLTDEEDVPDAVARLQVIYPNLMKLDYDNTRTRADPMLVEAGDAERRTELDWLDELYEKQNGKPMSDVQRRFSEALFEALKEGKA